MTKYADMSDDCHTWSILNPEAHDAHATGFDSLDPYILQLFYSVLREKMWVSHGSCNIALPVVVL